jgi:cation:H+ antiporter
MTEFMMLLVGLVLLIAGAELLVRCSVIVALRLGIPPLVVGLTIVSLGTSAPEIVASVAAALRGSTGIAIGNIVGSNLTNSLLVAGAAALLAPVLVSRASIARDGAVAMVGGALFWLLCAMQMLSVVTGTGLLLLLAGYILFSYFSEKRSTVTPGGDAGGEVDDVVAKPGRLPLPLAVLGAIAGAALLAFGGSLLVDAAISLAEQLGVSDAVIGLTVIAVGTSLPELATSMIAAARGRSEIAFGNVIGSNIFNVLGIGGLTAIISQGEVPGRLIAVDFPIMMAAMGLLLLAAITGHRINRLEGGILVVAFVIYVAFSWITGGR